MVFPIFRCNETIDNFVEGQWYPYEPGAELIKFDGHTTFVQLNGSDKVTAHPANGEVFATLEAANAECEKRNTVVPSKPTVWLCTALCLSKPYRTFVAAVKSSKEGAIKFATSKKFGLQHSQRDVGAPHSGINAVCQRRVRVLRWQTLWSPRHLAGAG